MCGLKVFWEPGRFHECSGSIESQSIQHRSAPDNDGTERTPRMRPGIALERHRFQNQGQPALKSEEHGSTKNKEEMAPKKCFLRLGNYKGGES